MNKEEKILKELILTIVGTEPAVMARIRRLASGYSRVNVDRMVWRLIDSGDLNIDKNHAIGITEDGSECCSNKVLGCVVKNLTDICCPMHDFESGYCEGLLIDMGCFSTCKGCLGGCDSNQQTETFMCNTCGEIVRRSYKWEADKEDKEDEGDNG